MTVTVIDRGPPGCREYRFRLREVEIAPVCPTCLGPRGRPEFRSQCEDGEWYQVSTWSNPCGHQDTYGAVLLEAGVYSSR